ncbi:MAG TPA: 1-deoxy-D-xylulose-5-phosphate reductoisomerase [Thermoanaerobaculaceae bacterium]|nr:1-deoxy-D-xylulose-5-phosphate reductoisomerase [Thermoanaerobaculaceae bacterium]HPS77558.1 1-deoxy-D-xylulose-5-phosphate reductoisomerase [Thermoanaerobaculaceae bacterium]
MKRLALLGSTGSIGTSTLDVVARFPERFEVVALAAGRNIGLVVQQARAFRPCMVAVADEEDARRLRDELPGVDVLAGEAGRIAVATHRDATTVVGALVGALGLVPTWRALEMGRDVLLANKETLVVAGGPVMDLARRTGARVLPIDSEHNALHQALRAGQPEAVRRLVLTASGGPFRTFTAAELEHVTVEQALAHPTWRMGAKISIDSATMMNKGLEIIEAHHLFDVPGDRIDVLVHPQSRVHSMVEFVDGTLIAQLSVNDMRFPILYALSYPERLPSPIGYLDLVEVGALTFEAVDETRFPALRLARAALAAGGGLAAVMNAANEVAVEAFLGRRLRFVDIAGVVEEAMDAASAGGLRLETLEDALAADASGRALAARLVKKWQTRVSG